MTLIFFEEISLEQLIGRSGFIFIVKKSSPDKSIDKMPFGEDKNEVHEQPVYHFEIIEELYNRDRIKQESNKIEVLPANSRLTSAMAQSISSGGPTPSPMLDEYKTEAKLDDLDELIIFLHSASDDRFEFTVHGAFESLSKKDDILGLIKQFPT
jgi:hypothetical protein